MTGGGSRNRAMVCKLGTDRTAERTPKDIFTTSETRDERKMSKSRSGGMSFLRLNTQKIQNDIV